LPSFLKPPGGESLCGQRATCISDLLLQVLPLLLLTGRELYAAKRKQLLLQLIECPNIAGEIAGFVQILGSLLRCRDGLNGAAGNA
jgi:hypothetical protein